MSSSKSSAVRCHVLDDVLVIEIHNPPINAGSLDVRRGLLQAIESLAHTSEWQASVIIGGGSTFIAGSDLKEFGKPLEDPQLPAVIAAIERCSKPIVAAISGAALGGGFELALGCDARVAEKNAIVGLPEVTLGMIPGAGGTQRLTRRVGITRSIDLICAGTRIPASNAYELGLIDHIAEGDLLTSAVQFAKQLKHQKNRISEQLVPQESPELIQQAEQTALKLGRHRPPVLAAIEIIKAAATQSFSQALEIERNIFNKLRLGPEANALRHLFFAERKALKLAVDDAPRPVNSIAVIGAGTMGASIAITAIDAGIPVVLLEQNDAALELGTQRIRDHYAKCVSKEKVTAVEAKERLTLLTSTTDWQQLSTVDLIIEAVFEELAVKQAVFQKIDMHAKTGAVLATNTSYLDIDLIAASTKRPSDVLGLHFFSPANVMKLLEVVRGSKTNAEVLATGMAFGKRLEKMAVPCGNAFGFIGNRIYDAYRRQCEFMIEDGAWPEEIDRALQSFGFAMGPFSVADMSGLDIAWRMRRARAAFRDPRERYVDVLDHLCELGRMGRKTGAGYYNYEGGKSPMVSDEVVRRLITDASIRRGIQRRQISPEEITRRALLAIVNEAALLISEGIAMRATDIDVVLVYGYGFPRWEGGPIHWARQQPLSKMKQDIESLVQANGHGTSRGDLSLLLDI